MTPLILLSLAMAALAGAWLTHPLWRPRWHGATPQRSGTPMLSTRTHDSLLLPAALALFIVVLAAGGYAWIGSANDLEIGPSTAPRAGATAREPRNQALARAETRITSAADRLAERLKADPTDADGWHMLGRSYAALGRHAQAIEAFAKAARLHPDDATLLAEWAFSAAVINPRGGDDDPVLLVERALRIDPRDPKALALAGTLALDRRDYQGAVDYWERLARVEPADSPIGRQIQASIAQVRQRALAQSALLPATAPATGTADVSGKVTLAAALRGRVSADDTVFVYARAPSGPRMPLAVLRKQVKDLPLRFTLDDSLAMAAGARLSGATSVVVGARISKAGSATAQDGDLQGQSAAVPVGSRDLAIEINEVVKVR